MPQASTFIRTCPALGWGMSRSTSSKFPRGLLICAAFIFSPINFPLSRCVNLHLRETAVDEQLYSRDVTCVGGSQKDDCFCNLVRCSNAAERNACLKHLCSVLPCVAGSEQIT